MKNYSQKRRISSMLIVGILIIALGMAFIGCAPSTPPDSDNDQDEATVVSIALNTDGVKKEFNFGEAFTYEGLKVTATMSDETTKDVPLADCRVSTPNTEAPGNRNVTVTYSGKTARYNVTVKARVYPEIKGESLLSITEENDSKAYRVEAEAMNMESAQKASGVTSFVATAPEDAEITGGGQYLTGFGVKHNYFGFKFTAAKEFKDVTVVFRLANSGKDAIADLSKNMSIYLNRAETEEGVTGALSSTATIDAGACAWKDVIVRNVTVKEGENLMTFDVLSESVPDIDYIDFYVGMRYISSVVELAEITEAPKMVDLEDFDTEKASTRDDWAAANPDKIINGLGLEEVWQEAEGKTTSRGTSVAALAQGSEMSTTIRVAQNATVKISFIAARVSSYKIKENWKFHIDGQELLLVESVDIKGRDGQGYWDWMPTSLGTYNIPAGDHFFAVKNEGSDCNIDGLTFEVLSMGSYAEGGVDLDKQEEHVTHVCESACPICGKCQNPDCTFEVCAEKCQGHCDKACIICGKCQHADNESDLADCAEKCNGCVAMEAEEMSKDNVVTRPDFAPTIGEGQYAAVDDDKASGGKRTYGFGAGTVFTVKINATEACTLDIFVRLFSDKESTFGENFEFTLDGAAVTQANPDATMTPNGTFKSVCVAQGVQLTAGEHTFTMKVLVDHFDFDCIGFSSATSAAPITVSSPSAPQA